MMIHNSLHASSKNFCTSGVGNTDYHQGNTLNQTVAELGVKSAQCIICDNAPPNGSLNTNAATRAILQYCNTPLPEMNLSPAQILFHRQLCVHLPVNSCYYHLHKYRIISSKQRKDYAHQQNQQTRETYNSPVTREHPALEVGTNVIIHNNWNSAKAGWSKRGTVDNTILKSQDLVVSFYVITNVLKKYPYRVRNKGFLFGQSFLGLMQVILQITYCNQTPLFFPAFTGSFHPVQL